MNGKTLAHLPASRSGPRRSRGHGLSADGSRREGLSECRGILRELYPSKEEVVRALYDDISHLNKEAQKFLLEKSQDRWIALHTMDFSFPSDDGEDDSDKPEGERRTFLKIAAGELDAKRQQAERAIADMAVPAGMDP